MTIGIETVNIFKQDKDTVGQKKCGAIYKYKVVLMKILIETFTDRKVYLCFSLCIQFIYVVDAA